MVMNHTCIHAFTALNIVCVYMSVCCNDCRKELTTVILLVFWLH